MSDHHDRTHAGHEHDASTPVAEQPMRVGAADDHAEHEAESRAQAALARLASRGGTLALSGARGAADSTGGDDGGRIRRAPSATTPGRIGLAGGELDPDAHQEIRARRGGGEPLPEAVRSSMESAFGWSFGDVRIHRDATAARLSRSISADAFTTGTDIYFGEGMFDTGSEHGRHVLAHELGHVVSGGSGVHRWNPFKKKEKSPEELKRAEDAKQRKEALIKARAELKAKDKATRQKAKEVNAKNKEVSASIKGEYSGNTDPRFKPQALKDLEMKLKDQLDLERYVRSKARHEVIQGQPETDELRAQADLAEEQAVDELWAKAPEDLRAFRPLRYDEFDRALNEVREAINEARAQEQGDIAKKLEENESSFGAPMSPKDAAKKVAEQRELERRRARNVQSKGETLEQRGQEDEQRARQKGMDKVAEIAQERPVGKGEEQQVKKDAARKGFEERYGHDQDLLDAKDGLKTTAKVTGYVGKGDKALNKQLISRGYLEKEGVPGEANELAAKSVGGLAEIFNLLSQLLGLADQIRDIKKGMADPGARLKATQTAVGAFSSGAKITRITLRAAREGVEKFGGQAQVISDVGTALPIVGLITASLGTIDKAIELVPLGQRLGEGLVTVDEAVLERKGPLAASLQRVNSRNAQLVEKASFGLAKNITMLGLHVAEIASAGGFGIPAAAKLTLTITDYAHQLGHKIYDTVNESQSSTAKKDFGVKHKEGASRDVLKYDIGTSIDVIIVSAQKHKLDYARKLLKGYGIRDNEIDGMRHYEIRDKVLDGLDAEGDPKTVTEKVESAKNAVKEKLGLDDGPGGGKKEEKGTLDKIKELPSKVAGAITGLPDKIAKKVAELKAKHADAKQLVDEKNKLGYHGKKDRGKGSVLFNLLRGEDKTEKSFAKVRGEQHVNGVAPDQLSRTSSDRDKRAKLAEQKQVARQVAPVHQFDPAFAAKVAKANMAELYQLVGSLPKTDPFYEGNLEYVDFEVARRVQEGIA
ncbi:eCIS core domain-containing protein [Nocardioides sp. BYT-33-1]|uniref:eCIS core domain-containing protein n=1 Tax=Nocardioides sp. BYT-33-1 TaxID=3416952 RepID=UPI003F53A970